jgi:hypothetical protein
MIENGPLTYKQALEVFTSQLKHTIEEGPIYSSCGGLNNGYIEYALQKITEAKKAGEDLQPAIDNAWVVFNNEYPIGS